MHKTGEKQVIKYIHGDSIENQDIENQNIKEDEKEVPSNTIRDKYIGGKPPEIQNKPIETLVKKFQLPNENARDSEPVKTLANLLKTNRQSGINAALDGLANDLREINNNKLLFRLQSGDHFDKILNNIGKMADAVYDERAWYHHIAEFFANFVKYQPSWVKKHNEMNDIIQKIGQRPDPKNRSNEIISEFENLLQSLSKSGKILQQLPPLGTETVKERKELLDEINNSDGALFKEFVENMGDIAAMNPEKTPQILANQFAKYWFGDDKGKQKILENLIDDRKNWAYSREGEKALLNEIGNNIKSKKDIKLTTNSELNSKAEEYKNNLINGGLVKIDKNADPSALALAYRKFLFFLKDSGKPLIPNTLAQAALSGGDAKDTFRNLDPIQQDRIKEFLSLMKMAKNDKKLSGLSVLLEMEAFGEEKKSRFGGRGPQVDRKAVIEKLTKDLL